MYTSTELTDEIIRKLDKELTEELTNVFNEYTINESVSNIAKKKRRTIKDVYEELIRRFPELEQAELPVIGKLTYEKFKKLVRDEKYRERFLKALGFNPKQLSKRKQQEIIKKIFEGKLSYKEGAILISNELDEFVQTIYGTIKNKKPEQLYELLKKLGISLIIAITVILAVGFFMSFVAIIVPLLFGVTKLNFLSYIVLSIITGMIINFTVTFISKIYMYLHSKLGTTIYGYVSLLAGVIGSVVLIKVSSFFSLITMLIIFLFWLVWELEILLLSKVENIYSKLHLDKYRKHTVKKTLELSLPTRLLLFILDKVSDLINYNLTDKLIDMVIKIEDAGDIIIEKTGNILDKILETVKRILTKLNLADNKLFSRISY